MPPMRFKKKCRLSRNLKGRARHSVRAAAWKWANGAQGTDAPCRAVCFIATMCDFESREASHEPECGGGAQSSARNLRQRRRDSPPPPEVHGPSACAKRMEVKICATNRTDHPHRACSAARALVHRFAMDHRLDSPAHSEEFLHRLMRRQLRLSIACAATFLIALLGLPLANYFFPELMATRILGFTLTWLILGVLFFPFVWFIAWTFIKRSIALEEDEVREAIDGSGRSRAKPGESRP